MLQILYRQLASIRGRVPFIVHPAPRIIKAPKPNNSKYCKSGKAPGAALNAILHPHGQNSNQEPTQQNEKGRKY